VPADTTDKRGNVTTIEDGDITDDVETIDDADPPEAEAEAEAEAEPAPQAAPDSDDEET
jgi:hypothetical protein